MLTPRRERERELIQLSKSSSSGSSPLRRADSDPVKQLNFNGVLSSSAPASPYRNTGMEHDQIWNFKFIFRRLFQYTVFTCMLIERKIWKKKNNNNN